MYGPVQASTRLRCILYKFRALAEDHEEWRRCRLKATCHKHMVHVTQSYGNRHRVTLYTESYGTAACYACQATPQDADVIEHIIKEVAQADAAVAAEAVEPNVRDDGEVATTTAIVPCEPRLGPSFFECELVFNFQGLDEEYSEPPASQASDNFDDEVDYSDDFFGPSCMSVDSYSQQEPFPLLFLLLFWGGWG